MPTDIAPSLDDFLTAQQLQDRFAVCRKTIQRWVRRGLPMTPVGRLQLFQRADVAAWLAQHGPAHTPNPGA